MLYGAQASASNGQPAIRGGLSGLPLSPLRGHVSPTLTEGARDELVVGTPLLTGQGLGDLLVDYDSDLDASLGGGLEHAVQSVLRVGCRGPAQVQLGTQPPVEDVDGLLGRFAAMAVSRAGPPTKEAAAVTSPWSASETAQKYEQPSTYHLAWPDDCGANEWKRWATCEAGCRAWQSVPAWVCECLSPPKRPSMPPSTLLKRDAMARIAGFSAVVLRHSVCGVWTKHGATELRRSVMARRRRRRRREWGPGKQGVCLVKGDLESHETPGANMRR